MIQIFTKTLDIHAPSKKKIMRGNQNRFMNKELSKAIMKRSRLKSKYHKTKNTFDRIKYKNKFMYKIERQGYKIRFSKFIFKS